MEGEATDSAARLRAALEELPEVRLGFLFGSHAGGRARSDSDFDVAVLVDQEAADAERGKTVRKIIARLGREVASDRIDLVILNDAPSLLRHRVVRDGVVLLERAEGERVRFVTATIRDYQDGSVRRDEFTRRRIERVAGSEATDGGPGDLLEKARGVARLLRKAEGVP